MNILNFYFQEYRNYKQLIKHDFVLKIISLTLPFYLMFVSFSLCLKKLLKNYCKIVDFSTVLTIDMKQFCHDCSQWNTRVNFFKNSFHQVPLFTRTARSLFYTMPGRFIFTRKIFGGTIISMFASRKLTPMAEVQFSVRWVRCLSYIYHLWIDRIWDEIPLEFKHCKDSITRY